MVVVSTAMNDIGGMVQAVVAPCLRYIAHVAAGTAVVVAAGTAVVVAASTAVPVAGGGDTVIQGEEEEEEEAGHAQRRGLE